jgi:hypothetical protein
VEERYVCVCMYACMSYENYAFMYACMHVNKGPVEERYVCTCMYVCTYAYICRHIHTYIHTYTGMNALVSVV